MPIGNAVASNTSRIATIQRWNFHFECIASTKRNNTGALYIADRVVRQPNWSCRNEQTWCPINWVRVGTINTFLNDWLNLLVISLFSWFYREAKRAISNFLCLGCQTVVITLGRDGAIFASAEEPRPIHIRTPRVSEVLDTTVSIYRFINLIEICRKWAVAFIFSFLFFSNLQGAGDAFVGALAHYFARYPDIPLYRKVGGAVTIASMSVQQYGTQYHFTCKLHFN